MDILTAKNVIQISEDDIKKGLLRAISACESAIRDSNEKPTEEQLKKLGRLTRMYNEMFNPP